MEQGYVSFVIVSTKYTLVRLYLVDLSNLC